MITDKISNIACLTQGIQVGIDKQFSKKNNESLVRFLRIIDYTQNKEKYRYIDNPGEKYLVNDNDVVMIRYGDAGRVVRGHSGAIANNLFKISIDNKLILNEYLYYYLSQGKIYNKLTNSQQKTGLPAVNFKMVNELDVTYPESIEKQKKIVEALDKAQELIDKRKAQIEALDELVKSRFIEMFGNPVINLKGWDSKDLGTLGYFKNGMNYKQSDSGFNIKFLGVGEFKYGNVINSSNMLSTLELQEEPNEEYLLKKGDIVFVRSNGSKELVGRSVLVRELEEKTTYSGFCIRYRNQCEEVTPDFLIQLFSDENFKKLFKKDSRGANINNLNQQMLSSLKIIVPPIELQNQFTDFVKQVGKLKFEMQKSLTQLEDNFNSLMQRAFKGELFN